MQISFGLCLPRDAASVPVVRHICGDALLKLGVETTCVDDIQLAVTEACTNVLDHASDGSEEYEVTVEIDERICAIRVIDSGDGFDATVADAGVSSTTAESGRGVFLMRSMVDNLKFVSKPEDGTMVHLVKRLVLEENSLLGLLSSPRRTATGAGSAGR